MTRKRRSPPTSEPVDEVRHRLRFVATLALRLGHRRERGRHALGERLPGLPRPQPTGIRERPLQPVPRRRVGQVVELELVRPADTVRPVGADPEPHHVGDDQQRRAFPLVLPGEVVAFPDVGPAVAAGVLVRAPLKAVRLAGRVRLGRCRLVEQTVTIHFGLPEAGTPRRLPPPAGEPAQPAEGLGSGGAALESAIFGQVLDAAGEPMPGTTIAAAVAGAARAARVEVADRQGEYRISNLPPGTYTVIFHLPGFRSVVRNEVVVGSGFCPAAPSSAVTRPVFPGRGFHASGERPAACGSVDANSPTGGALQTLAQGRGGPAGPRTRAIRPSP